MKLLPKKPPKTAQAKMQAQLAELQKQAQTATADQPKQ